MNELGTLPKTNMAMENHHFELGDTSSNGSFSIFMLVFGGVMLVVYYFLDRSPVTTNH